MAMRTTTHHGRGKGGKAYGSKHNDRNFDVMQANNIIPELTAQNEYWSLIEAESFEAAELKFYEENFSEQLQATNDKYVANRHPERCKTMEQWKEIKQNAPEETILQIGKKHDEFGTVINQYPDSPELMAIFREFSAYEEKWNAEHGNPFTVLNVALHVDEPNCPPHIHARKVWHYQNEEGNLRIGQERALELAGVELPNPSKPTSRYNNRKMTYDKLMREKWLDICEAHGIEVERVPLPGRKKSKDLEEHVREKFEKLDGRANEIQANLDKREALKPHLGFYKASEVDTAFARHHDYPNLEKERTEAVRRSEVIEKDRDAILDEAKDIIAEKDAEIQLKDRRCAELQERINRFSEENKQLDLENKKYRSAAAENELRKKFMSSKTINGKALESEFREYQIEQLSKNRNKNKAAEKNIEPVR